MRYFVVGGLAVVAHGHPRFTADLDLVIALAPANIRRATEVFSTLGYRPAAPVPLADRADPVRREEWATTKSMQVLQLVCDERPETSVDVFIREPFDAEAEMAAAVRAELFPGLAVPVVSYATLVAMKQAAGRPQDLDDVRRLALGRSP